jgi:hypothetical protein
VGPGRHSGPYCASIGALQDLCAQAGVQFIAQLRREDFLAAGVSQLDAGLFASAAEPFDAVILNPP